MQRSARPQSAVSTASILLPLLLVSMPVANPTDACVGPPPEPVCTKTLALAIAGPPTVLLPAGGSIDVAALVFFNMIEFPAGFGACPSGPYAVDVEISATCEGGGSGGGEAVGQPIVLGHNELKVGVAVPAGPPRRCKLTATARLTLTDGMVLTESADNLVCLAEPAPGKPALPRLEIEHLGLPGSELARVHPGDQALHSFRVTNNDPSATFSGSLSAVSENESRQPGSSGPMPFGTAVISVSDPATGDHFPIDLDPGLPPGFPGSCLPLPADPLAFSPPAIASPILLDPLESQIISIRSRSWGMCADGSCSDIEVDITGFFDDMDPAVACTGFVTAVDLDAPPARDCADGGEKAQPAPPPNPQMPFITLTGEPRPGFPVRIDILADLAVTMSGTPLAEPLTFAETLGEEQGRVQFQVLYDGSLGIEDIDARFEIDFDVAEQLLMDFLPQELGLTGAPSGFETQAPFAELEGRIVDRSGTFGDSTLLLTTQVSAVGIFASGRRIPIRFGQVQFAFKPAAGGLSGGLTGSLSGGKLDPPPAPDPLLALEIAMDLRGFLSPEPELDSVFTDGFESGNVTRWSSNAP